LCLHACGITILVLLGEVQYSLPTEHREAIILPSHNEKLVWYFSKNQLPEVASGEQVKAGKPKIELRRPGQVITTEVTEPEPGKQFIWQPPPKIAVNRETPSPNLLVFTPKPVRPVPRTFVPPPPTKVMPKPLQALPEPSPLMVAPAVPEPLPLTAAIPGPSKPRPRQFAPPVAPGAAPSTVVLETAPNLPLQTQQPSIVVVGLDPALTSEIALPEGSRATHLSAGPESGTAGGEHTAAMVVPGLNVHGNGTGSAVVVGPAPKIPEPYHEPSAVEWARTSTGKDSRRLARSMMSVALRPSARVIASWVETRFFDRPVYTTSYEVGADASTEWVIWFAEQNVRDGQYLTIRPPVPWSQTAAAPEPPRPIGRFEVAAVIDKNGQPTSVKVVKGGDQSVNEAAAKLLSEWTFLPALRNGEPISVDTLIELNFRSRP